MSLLLDTNVISETTKTTPNPRVLHFLANLGRAHISVVSIHEIHFGICRMPMGRRRSALATYMEGLLASFDKTIVDVDRSMAYRAGALRAGAQAQGRVLQLADSLIAATALECRFDLATRNVGDFSGLGITIVNPWD